MTPMATPLIPPAAVGGVPAPADLALAHLALRLISEAAMPCSVAGGDLHGCGGAELRSRIGQRLQDALRGLEALVVMAFPEADPVLQQWWQPRRSSAATGSAVC